jgi:glyoxylase-like metal-dependent hydrolase (beta-lactamase superfamily II)
LPLALRELGETRGRTGRYRGPRRRNVLRRYVKGTAGVNVHCLNCGTMHPRLAPIFAPRRSRGPSLCMLIETERRLVLIDAGFGTRDMSDLRRLGLANLLLNARADPLTPAVRQIERLGFDVTDIICTHLDRDHAGGLRDFPGVRVHVLPEEVEAATKPRKIMERERYRRCHFERGPKWVTHRVNNSARWFGMECIRGLPELPPEIVMIPLQGYTHGHCGVAVDTGHGWVLHCGDAYYLKRELAKKAPIGVRSFRRMAHLNLPRAEKVMERIERAVEESQGAVTTIAAHDRTEHRRLVGRDLD